MGTGLRSVPKTNSCNFAVANVAAMPGLKAGVFSVARARILDAQNHNCSFFAVITFTFMRADSCMVAISVRLFITPVVPAPFRNMISGQLAQCSESNFCFQKRKLTKQETKVFISPQHSKRQICELDWIQNPPPPCLSLNPI